MKFTQARINAFRPPADGPKDYQLADENMSGFVVRFRKNRAGVYGEGTYYTRARVGHKDINLPIAKVSKITLVDAQAIARGRFAMIANKVNPSTERRKAVAKVNETLADNISGFLDYLRNVKERSAGHIDEVQRSLRRHFAPLHPFNAADIDPAMVSVQLDRITIASGASTSDHCRSHLSTYYAWMIATGKHRGLNPVSGTPTNGRRPRDKVPNGAEMRPIWAALPPPGDDYGDIFRTLFFTGMRREEVAAMTRDESL